MPAKHSNNKQFILISILLVVLLFLTFLNIRNYYLPKTVLGIITSEEVSNSEFWDEYLKSNPNYIPGWLEIGRTDKALEIDPNYQLKLK